MKMKNHAIFIDPSSEHFLNDRLFDVNDDSLNRDGTLLPFARLQKELCKKGIAIHTADKLRDGSQRRELNEYWSLGLIPNFQEFIDDDKVRLRGFILMEPPLVQPESYHALPMLTNIFDHVYLHNTRGDGYDCSNINQDRLRTFEWPQPYSTTLPQYWNNTNRFNKLVVIAGSHRPRRGFPELYSKRIEALAALGPLGAIDLYGRGWYRWWGSHARWPKYWRHIDAILKNYQGPCRSKWEVLSQYRFSLCFENMEMTGYITEKIFDCLYAGTVPVYLGAPDINELIPKECYIDMRNYSCFLDLYDSIASMSNADWVSMRECGHNFLTSESGLRYTNSLNRIFSS